MKKTRVVFYARVSKDTEEQLHSFEAQKNTDAVECLVSIVAYVVVTLGTIAGTESQVCFISLHRNQHFPVLL